MRRYLEHRGVLGSTEQGIYSSERAIRDFIVWGDERGVTHPQQVTRSVLERYQRWLYHYRKKDGEPLSVASRRSKIVPLRGFFKWLTRSGEIDANPAADLDLPRQIRRLPRSVLSHAEAEQVLALPDLGKPLGLRDRAIMEVLYASGMRRAEVARLEIGDIDAARALVLIRQGKGRKDRLIPLGERALHWVQQYLDRGRPQLVWDYDDSTLFLSMEGRPMSIVWLSTTVARYVERGTLGKHGGCHIWRHTMATLMLEGGADIRFIQAMLGHAEISTTQIYAQVAVRQLQQVHAMTHPAGVLASKQTGREGFGIPALSADERAVADRTYSDSMAELREVIDYTSKNPTLRDALLRSYSDWISEGGLAKPPIVQNVTTALGTLIGDSPTPEAAIALSVALGSANGIRSNPIAMGGLLGELALRNDTDRVMANLNTMATSTVEYDGQTYNSFQFGGTKANVMELAGALAYPVSGLATRGATLGLRVAMAAGNAVVEGINYLAQATLYAPSVRAAVLSIALRTAEILHVPAPVPGIGIYRPESPKGTSIAVELSPGRSSQSTTRLSTSSVEEQARVLAGSVPGLSETQARALLEAAQSRDLEVVLGGSRVRSYFDQGTFRPDSDLDTGFNNAGLSSGKLGRVLDAFENAGELRAERGIKIVTGNETKNVPKIESPQEFFQRSGFRTEPGRVGEPFAPSGSITVRLDGTIIFEPPRK